MAKYRIKARHEVLCDYIIEAGSEDEAVEKLCLSECQWTEYSGGELLGPDDALLASREIEVDYDSIEISDACATKTYRRASWDVEAEKEEECDVE